MTSGAHVGSKAGDAIRKGVGLVHGTGEAIRGDINAAVDAAAGDRQGAAKNEAIANRGIDEMEHGHYHGTGAGVTPVDTARERQDRAAQGEFPKTADSSYYAPQQSSVGSKIGSQAPYESSLGPHGTQLDGSLSNYDLHATNLGNRLDPRYDSDLDYRGPTAGSSNHGPHSTSFGNKLDPQYDSDLDHRGPLPGASSSGSHDNTLVDPQRGYEMSQYNPSRYHYADDDSDPLPRTMTRRETAPMQDFGSANPAIDHSAPPPLPPRRRMDEDPLRFEARRMSQHAVRHETRFMNVPDPSVREPVKGEPHSTNNPHKSSFLKLLDPRVDRPTVKKRSWERGQP